ncbi:MAG: AAA family ATPase [Lachnospiraceae bacterium]|nr:AAA family ATPase [Lachnospiraceae bacterium]
MTKYRSRLEELEAEIAQLPAGYISRKTIYGKVKQYYQWTEDGRKKSRYLNDAAAEEMRDRIERRRELQKELKELKELRDSEERRMARKPVPTSAGSPRRRGYVAEEEVLYHTYKTDVLVGNALRRFVEPARGLRKRDCYQKLETYLWEESFGRVFILYGLRRTGKTTLIRQAIGSMTVEDYSRTAFIQLRPGNNLGDVNQDLRWLADHGYRYVFLDEVTLAEDFIEGAALFSDIYAASGMKVVLSGTDSLGFRFSESDELYDRCILLHTTWIPYREFERVLGVSGIDEYIRYGGTMSLGGQHYNETSTFVSRESADEYVDSAIAGNIKHSLRYYRYGGHFRHLAELYDRNELTSAINRVVEDINHRFTIRVLTEDFVSHDLGISAANLRKDRKKPINTLDHIDKTAFTEGLRHMLEIRNKSEQSVAIDEAHRSEIKEYLDLLDLTVDIPTEQIPPTNERAFRTVIAQPGLRFAQAEAFVRQILLDEVFANLSAVDRAMILERILNEIRGRMTEEIVLLETKMALSTRRVFRLQFTMGEYDMVVVDPDAVTCEIYEIKHSRERDPKQCVHLVDTEKLAATEFRYGTITKRCVIYRGEDVQEGDILYRNVENYLKNLV